MSFEPEFGRASALNARMYRELASSLRHVAEVIGDSVPFDAARFASLCDRLEQGRPHDPVAFAHYYRLVEALMADDRTLAATLLQQLAAVPPKPESEIVALGPELGEERSRLYAAMVEEDEPLRLDVAPPAADAVSAFRPVLAQAMALIEAAAPALADEIGGLARQIVLVGQAPTRESVFDGGSHFRLWNALFLNIDRPRSRVALAEVIAHECAHSLLFGYCIDEALTQNEDHALYASPLRDDPRPMDGIYHATFVSARMYWLMSRLLASALLDADETAEVSQAVERDRRNFEAGHAVVAEHGLLTETGRRLMAGARAFMDNAPQPGRQQAVAAAAS